MTRLVVRCFLLSLLLVAAYAVSPRFAERRRRGGISSKDQVTCAELQDSKWADALAKIKFIREGKGDSKPLVEIKDNKVKYIKGVRANTNDAELSTSAEIPFKQLDLCKVFPQTFCGQTDVTGEKQKTSTNFCDQGDNNKKLCCPLAGRKQGFGNKFKGTKAKPEDDGGNPLSTGCTPGKVAGVARGFMPQIDKEEDFIKFFKTLNDKFEVDDKKPANKDITPKEENVAVDAILPSQDEMFLFKTVSKMCPSSTTPDAKPIGTPGFVPSGTKDFVVSRLAICKKDADGVSGKYFILDGHHRYSQKVLCSAVKDCVPHSVDPTKNLEQIAVKVWQESCSNLIYASHHLLEYKEELNVEAGSGSSEKKGGIHFAQAAFTELEARFGRAAHKTETEAARAFVATSRQRLAAAGLSLKGGDKALHQWWEIHHKSNLWN